MKNYTHTHTSVMSIGPTEGLSLWWSPSLSPVEGEDQEEMGGDGFSMRDRVKILKTVNQV